jgi:hypothetical protein
MKFDLIKTIISVIGFVASWKIIFFIFSPSELSVIIIITLLLFAAYGIQLIEWPEESSVTILGLSVYESRKIKQQYRIFGLIPISGVMTIKSQGSFFKDLDPYVALPFIKAVISSVPFGGLFSSYKK